MRQAHGTAILFFCLFVGGCGAFGTGKSIYDDSSAVQSPHGTVPFGAKAYSPDGTRYAREIEPRDIGHISVFNKRTNESILQFQALPQNIANDLKGMAWSRCSNYLAIMYHGGLRPGINLYNAHTGELVRFIGNSNSHYMVFSEDNLWIITPYEQFPSGLERTR